MNDSSNPLGRCIAVGIVALLWLSPIGALAGTLKLATLVPAGSTWDRALQEMAGDWQDATDGRLQVRFYPGGVAGDDPDVVRKMRIGQLQAATLTVTGLAEIHEGFRIFTVPMLFRDYEELYGVIDRLRPTFEAALRQKGFELVHWVPGGWVRFFSDRSLTRVEDLQAAKLFTWAGDDGMVRAWQRNGFQPVALAYTDIPMGLESGLIDALPATPLAALSLQWFRRAPHMLDLGVAPLIGATVIRTAAWKKISEADRKAIADIAMLAEHAMRETIADQDRSALTEMTKRGLEVSTAESEQEWQALADRFSHGMRGTLVPEELYGEVEKALETLRSSEQ